MRVLRYPQFVWALKGLQCHLLSRDSLGILGEGSLNRGVKPLIFEKSEPACGKTIPLRTVSIISWPLTQDQKSPTWSRPHPPNISYILNPATKLVSCMLERNQLAKSFHPAEQFHPVWCSVRRAKSSTRQIHLPGIVMALLKIPGARESSVVCQGSARSERYITRGRSVFR